MSPINTATEKTTSPVSKAGTLRVSKTVRLKGQKEQSDSSEELLDVHEFQTTPAIAHASIPLKITQDYQSLGIEIGVSLPCYAEELDVAMKAAFNKAFDEIKKRIPEIQDTLAGITGRKVLNG